MAGRSPAASALAFERVDFGADGYEFGGDRGEAVGNNPDIVPDAFRQNRGVPCELVTRLSHLGAKRLLNRGKLPSQARLHARNPITKIGPGSIEIVAE